MVKKIEPHEMLTHDEINSKYKNNWVAVIYNDPMFNQGIRRIVAIGDDTEDDWNALMDYVETQTTKEMHSCSMLFGDPHKDEGDLYVVFRDI